MATFTSKYGICDKVSLVESPSVTGIVISVTFSGDENFPVRYEVDLVTPGASRSRMMTCWEQELKAVEEAPQTKLLSAEERAQRWREENARNGG